jgi:uncharacterized membrane protein YeaQ/YmgE (transglycosylase-associated protein family)
LAGWLAGWLVRSFAGSVDGPWLALGVGCHGTRSWAAQAAGREVRHHVDEKTQTKKKTPAHKNQHGQATRSTCVRSDTSCSSNRGPFHTAPQRPRRGQRRRRRRRRRRTLQQQQQQYHVITTRWSQGTRLQKIQCCVPVYLCGGAVGRLVLLCRTSSLVSLGLAAGRLAGRLTERPLVCFALPGASLGDAICCWCWLVGWLVGWLAGWFIGGSVGLSSVGTLRDKALQAWSR